MAHHFHWSWSSAQHFYFLPVTESMPFVSRQYAALYSLLTSASEQHSSLYMSHQLIYAQGTRLVSKFRQRSGINQYQLNVSWYNLYIPFISHGFYPVLTVSGNVGTCVLYLVNASPFTKIRIHNLSKSEVSQLDCYIQYYCDALTL